MGRRPEARRPRRHFQTPPRPGVPLRGPGPRPAAGRAAPNLDAGRGTLASVGRHQLGNALSALAVPDDRPPYPAWPGPAP